MDVLRHFPEIADRHYRPVLKLTVADLYATIAPNIPVKTGRASQTFNSQVTGKAFSLRGKVGWFKSGDPWYINVIEHGAKEHEIQVEPRERTALKWGDGAFSKGHAIRHPGLSARGFMAAGYSRIQGDVERDLAMANERIVAELAAI
jgi:hypothetical protein